MSLSKLLSFAVAGIALSSLLAGCAVEAQDDASNSEDAIRARDSIMPGSFKLYGVAHANPTPGCDVHTVLTLANDRAPKAKLRNVVGGFCDLYVEPNEREFRLRLDGTSCGSKIYKGTRTANGKQHEVTITDHRTRVCRDLVPAKVIVEETDVTESDVVRLFSFDGAPAPVTTATWLTIAPKQCGSNPWSGAQPGAGQDPSYLQGEAGEVDNFLKSRAIKIDQIGFASPSEPMMVCAACSCPRGDSLIVHAATTADAQLLITELGFSPMTGAVTRAPTQCGTNPWEQNQSGGPGSSEIQQLASWATDNGAPLTAAAFVDYTEPRMVCMACSCPRGDVAVAFPKDATSSSKLESLGWTRVEN